MQRERESGIPPSKGGKSRTRSFADYRIEFQTTLTMAILWIMHWQRRMSRPGKCWPFRPRWMGHRLIIKDKRRLLFFFCRSTPWVHTTDVVDRPQAAPEGCIRDPSGWWRAANVSLIIYKDDIESLNNDAARVKRDLPRGRFVRETRRKCIYCENV